LKVNCLEVGSKAMKLADVGVGTIDLRAQVEAPHFSAAGELVEPTAVVCVLS